MELKFKISVCNEIMENISIQDSIVVILSIVEDFKHYLGFELSTCFFIEIQICKG